MTNPGTEPLSNVTVRDDNGTADTADDFSPVFKGGDTNNNGLLDPGETWTYTATGTVGTAGYCNVGDRVGHERHHRDRDGPGVLPRAGGHPAG